MLLFDDYQRLVMRTRNPGILGTRALLHGVLGLTGEGGEVADLIKKHVFQGHELDRTKVIEEIGDGLWYSAYLADALGSSMEAAAMMNVSKLQLRYPDGFLHRDSINRVEKL